MKKISIKAIWLIAFSCIANFLHSQCTSTPAAAWNWANGASQTSQARFFGNRYIAYDEFHNIYSLAQLEGGTVTIGGINVSTYYGNDHILVKQDQNGNVLWAKTFGTSQNDFLTSIGGMVCNQNGSIFITMYCDNLHINGQYQPVTNVWQDDVIQFDYNGNFVADVYQSGRMKAIEFYNGDLYFGDHFTVVKRNAQGTTSPVVQLNPGGDIYIWNIRHAPNGDMVVTGYFSTSVSYGGTTVYTKSGSLYSEFLFRVNAAGNLVYGFSMDGTTNSLSNLGIAFDSYSNLLMTGQPQTNPWRYQNTSLSINYSLNTVSMLLKLDAVNGNMIWDRQYSTFGSQMGYGQSLICNPNNEILIMGNYHQTGVIPYSYCLPDYQNFILKLNENGEKIYFQNFGLSGNTNSGLAFTTWDHCKYFIAGLGGDIYTNNNAKFNCLSYTYQGSYFTASYNDYSFEINANGIDDDCDGQIDENVPNYKLWYRDADDDGFGNAAIITYACTAPAGYVGNASDCDDNNDEIGFTHWYIDADGDGFGDANDPGIASCTPVAGRVSNNKDCDDNNNQVNPSATEICNGIDDNCDGYVDMVPIDGLKMYLPLNGNANDISGNNHNGKIYHATLTADRFGNANKAYYFNGSNAHIDVKDHPVFRSSEITIGCWVNSNNPTTNQGETVLSKTVGPGFYNSYAAGYTYNTGRIGGFYGGEGYYNEFSASGPQNGNWFHLVWSYSDANNLSKLYINGAPVATQATSISLGFDDKPFVIGGEYSYYPQLQYLLEGMVDDVVFFDRFLSDDEVAWLHQNGPYKPLEKLYFADADGDHYGTGSGQTFCEHPGAGWAAQAGDCDDTHSTVYPGAPEICDGLDNDCDGITDLIRIVGLQLYLPFNGNANDLSGKNHHGTIINAVPASGHKNDPSTAYDFNGTNARIDVADHPDLRPQSLTLSAWVYYTSVPGNIQSIIGKGYCSGWSDSYSFWFENGQLHAGLGYDSYGLANYVFSPPAANQWHHLVLTFDNPSDIAKVYIDNVLAGTFNAPFDLRYENSAFMVGSDWDQCIYNWYYKGKADEVMLFNRALHASEVNALYTNSPFVKLTTVYYADGDRDGFGAGTGQEFCLNPGIGWSLQSEDCNDMNPAVHPGVTEVCNGIDDDCDGLVDEKLPAGFKLYLPFTGNANDASGNGHDGTVYNASLSSDMLGNPNCAYSFNGTNSRIEIPDHADFHLTNISIAYWVKLAGNTAAPYQTHVSKSFGNSYFNSYASGYGSSGIGAAAWTNGSTEETMSSPTISTNNWYHQVFTFDDAGNVANIYINGIEVASKSTALSLGYDNSPLTVGFEYQFGGPLFHTFGTIDEVVIFDHALSFAEIQLLYQNKGNIIIPLEEVCNGIDDDCNGLIDEGLTKTTYYQDLDEDGFGNPEISVQACTQPEGYVLDNTDCNDNDANIHSPVQYYIDNDHDGYGSTTTAMLCSSTAPAGYSTNNTDCKDDDANIHSPVQFYVDNDHDGYGSTTTAMLCSLTAPAGYSTNNTDCNDNDAGIHAPVQYYVDNDHDGYGSVATAMLCTLTAPSGYSPNNNDCNDNDAGIHAPVQYYVDNDHDGYGSAATAMLCTLTAPAGYSPNNTDCNDNDAGTHENCACAISATCSSNTADNNLYFGYNGDQSATITITPSGGTAPYTVAITMSRPLLCNQINDAGDETWTGGAGGTTTNNSCPANPGLATLAPVSFKAITSGSYSVTVTLMADADIVATITDATGCTTTCSTHIHADDVRCFAGKSNISKVTLCHKTGSTKNPCVTICVDEDAVSEHMAHGDFVGKCTSNCIPRATTVSMKAGDYEEKSLPDKNLKNTSLIIFANPTDQKEISYEKQAANLVYPNPADQQLTLKPGAGLSAGKISLQIVDRNGAVVKRSEHINSLKGQAITLNTTDLASGLYLVVITDSKGTRMEKKVVIAH